MQINHIPKIIIFDLDGTFYPYSCIVKSNYDNAVRFFNQKYNFSNEYIYELFSENNIFPYITEKNASITEFILSKGVDLSEWNDYRNSNFVIDNIPKMGKDVVNVDTLIKFSNNYLIVLLSSSTKKKLFSILERLNISPTIFRDIFTLDDFNNHQNHINKYDAFVFISKQYTTKYNEMLSIGDRYLTDIKPMIDLGGNGFLVKHPKDIEDVYLDLVTKDARIYDVQYKWFLI